MTFQEAHKEDTSLVARRNLTKDELKSRLKNYYTDEKIDEILNDVGCFDVWCDGEVAVLSTFINTTTRFIVVANGKNYMKLIEP